MKEFEDHVGFCQPCLQIVLCLRGLSDIRRLRVVQTERVGPMNPQDNEGAQQRKSSATLAFMHDLADHYREYSSSNSLFPFRLLPDLKNEDIHLA